ncbi:MAG: IS630 family transposase [Chloroflexi bacterium]|nr:IS630 family transposase [Chloroflexota bacterium]
MLLRQPTDGETRELKRMTRQEIGRVSQRAQIVLLAAQRRMYTEIARILETTTVTVVFWIGRFNREGPAGLYDEPRSGRPRKVTKEVVETTAEIICDDPQREGYVATFWTVAMMVLALVGKLGVELSPSSIRGVFKGLDLRWGRPRLAMPNKTDPEKARKQWLIAQTVIEAGPEAVILYADECRVQLLPLIRAMWHWVGQQIRVPTPGSNDWRALFGALNIRTGQWTYVPRRQMKKEDFVFFLDHLLSVYPTEVVVLIVDNYSSHTAGAVSEWLEAHSRLKLLYLPKYCSHLNPVEQIWLRMKNKIAANRLYGSMQLLLDSVNEFFKQMTPDQALEWAAA